MNISIEKKREYDHEYHLKNREKKCRVTKEWRVARDSEQREKDLAYNCKYNKEHASEKAAHNRNRMERRKAWILEYKKTHSCKCGESHPACIDFHHRNPKDKKFEISDNTKGRSLKTLKEEVAKCIVLCANCHRKLHWGNGK